ncbi:hypothetical protein ACFWFQ_34305 [Nocardia salmonicida]|uniref:hypothetical protein n=1 Tax=Nocardia salmonicida TaxID=53431 RepID=UPI00364BA0E3
MHEIADTVDIADLELTPTDTAEIDRLARALCTGAQDRVDDPAWVARPGIPGMRCR